MALRDVNANKFPVDSQTPTVPEFLPIVQPKPKCTDNTRDGSTVSIAIRADCVS